MFGATGGGMGETEDEKKMRCVGYPHILLRLSKRMRGVVALRVRPGLT